MNDKITFSLVKSARADIKWVGEEFCENTKADHQLTTFQENERILRTAGVREQHKDRGLGAGPGGSGTRR